MKDICILCIEFNNKYECQMLKNKKNLLRVPLHINKIKTIGGKYHCDTQIPEHKVKIDS